MDAIYEVGAHKFRHRFCLYLFIHCSPVYMVHLVLVDGLTFFSVGKLFTRKIIRKLMPNLVGGWAESNFVICLF